MTITLYDTRTRQKQPLVPVTPGKASMYVCGPTVYDRAHIGNARPVVVFDVLYRLLRHTYGEGNVTYVRNITDVEDKINARARAAGRPIGEITAETTRWFHEDMDALGALRPTFEPRATEYIGEMVAMIALLVERGHAYAAEGHVLFSVGSYPEYGALARRSLDDMRAGARVEVAPYKRDPMDFVLWKPSDAETPGWESPWGRGRPGWHIECSAMARALLGAEFDIHGGGVDLAFPHHENELAQSACAHPDEGFAKVWMHNGMLNIEGEKMSKSLGNFFTVRDLLDRGVPGEVIRFVLLSTHYRRPLDWTERRVAEAQRTLEDWYFLLHQAGYSSEMVALLRSRGHFDPDAEFKQFLLNDLNSPGAMKRLHQLARSGTASQLSSFAASLELLGYVEDWSILADLARLGVSRVGEYEPWVTELVTGLLFERSAARAMKDFDRADRIRASLVAAGVVVEDTGGVSGWRAGPEFNSKKLKALE